MVVSVENKNLVVAKKNKGKKKSKYAVYDSKKIEIYR